MTDVYVVAGTGPWSRTVFDERLATRPGRWVFAGASRELTAARLEQLRPRYVFFLHWSWKVPAEILNAHECIGFHMTDLPYGRGGSPLQNLILRGHRTTTLAAYRLVEAVDAGPVYLKTPVSLDGRAEDIYLRVAHIAADMIADLLQSPRTPTPQDGEVVVFRRRSPADSRVPEVTTLERVYDFIRMLDAEGYPRAFTEVDGWRYEFSNASLDGDSVRAEVRISPLPTTDQS